MMKMITKNKYIILLFFCTFVFYKKTNAQLVKTETQVAQKNVIIGDEIKVKNLIIFNPEEVKISLPIIPDSFNHFEILNEVKVDTIQNNNITTLIQNISMICFDSGYWEIPNFKFNIFPKNGNDSFEDSTKKIGINVNTVAVDTTNKQLPFFDIIEAEKPLWEKIKYYVFGILGLLLLLFLIYFYKKWKNKNKTLPIKIVQKISPKEKALNDLKIIAENYTFPVSNLKKYYTEISDVLRSYLEDQFGMETFEKTSSEIISSYKKLVQKERSESGFDRLRTLLLVSDNVKFAKGKPSEFDIENAIHLAKSVIEKSDSIYKKLNQQPLNESN